jgi:adenylate cyclase
MIGEEVNLASRLESGAKSYGIYFHSTYKTLEKAGLERYDWRYIDKVIFKGFSDWKQTVEILGYKSETNDKVKKLIKFFHQGLDYYYKRDWSNATKSFKTSLKYELISHSNNFNPSSIFIERCNYYDKNNPSSDWNGIYKLDRK